MHLRSLREDRVRVVEVDHSQQDEVVIIRSSNSRDRDGTVSTNGVVAAVDEEVAANNNNNNVLLHSKIGNKWPRRNPNFRPKRYPRWLHRTGWRPVAPNCNNKKRNKGKRENKKKQDCMKKNDNDENHNSKR